MRMKLRNLGWLAAGGALLLAVACGAAQQADPSFPAVETAATPNIPATQQARVQSAPLGAPTPTPVPAQVSSVTLEFAQGHRSVNQTWDQLHRDLDTWRQGLISCDPSSVQVALRRFSGSASAITESARGLSRHATVRGLSDQLIQAAEQEEEALRLLRDTWQPGAGGTIEATDRKGDSFNPDSSKSGFSGRDFGNGGGGSESPGGRSVFEGVDLARSAASSLQQDVADQLTDLQANTTDESQSQLAAFDSAFQELAASWDQFHSDYDSFRAGETQRSSTATVEGLGRLVSQFREVVLAVRDLPPAPGAEPVAQRLADTAAQEDLALRLLRGTFQKSQPSAPADTGRSTGSGFGSLEAAPKSSASSGDGEEFVATDPSLFDAFDAALVEANEARRRAGQDLTAALDRVSPDGRTVLADFSSEYGQLLEQWASFHQDYGRWRSTEGGCDRTKAISALGEFTIRYAALSSSVRDLPRATVLQPMGELLVEAAQREEAALRELRDGWQPFDPQVYQALDQQRSAAGKLRRQVALGIQELLERYALTLPPPETG